MYVPQLKQNVCIYPVLLAETNGLVMYNCSFGTDIVHKSYVYIKLWKITQKDKIKDFNSPRNEPLIVLDYWPNKIEEYFHLRNPYNIIYMTNLQHRRLQM